MTGPQQQVLRIVKQLKKADLETLASTMAVSIDYVKDICHVLVQNNLLHQEHDGEYMVTRGGSRIQTTGMQSSDSHNRTQKDMNGDEKRYTMGEVIGEIKMKADLPSPEQVETALRSSPQSSYEEMEERLTVHTLICPAKGKEVPWFYCSACPHQKEMDFQRGTVQCSYEFNERRLDMVYGEEEIKALARGENGELTDLNLEEFVALPYVKCPSLNMAVPVDRCVDCRYHRGGEWRYKSKKRGVVGWVLCGAPSFIEERNDDSRMVKYGGKEWRSVPPRWK